MKVLVTISLCLGGFCAEIARGEAGPGGLGDLRGPPPMPLMEDPSALLDEMPVAPPPPAEIKTESTALPALGKLITAPVAPANLPAASTIHPETAVTPKEQKPLIPVTRSEGSASVSLPPSPQPPALSTLASPVALPQNTGPATSQVLPETRTPENSEKMVETKVSLTPPAPSQGPELAIVLSEGKFHPARIRLKQGEQTRLLFTTIGKKPAALIIERLRVQKWLARPEEAALRTPASTNQPWEVNREVSANRLTEIILDPVRGTYSFHDAISGAAGEIVVE